MQTVRWVGLGILLSTLGFGCATSIEDVEGFAFDGGRDTGALPDEDSSTPDTGSSKPDSGTAAPDTATADTGVVVTDTFVADTFVTDTFVTDTFVADTFVADTFVADTFVADTAVSDAGSVTSAAIVFPAAATDLAVIANAPYMWTNGDYLEGSRTTGLASATSLTGVWDIVNEVGTCGLFGTTTGKVNVDILLNGTKIGSLVIKGSTGASVPITLTFPAITGPTYKLRYQLTATVASGCGQVQSKWDTSKLTLK